MKIQSIFLSFLAAISLNVTLVNSLYANTNDNNSIIITQEMISSYQKCPITPTSQLKCSAYHQSTNYTCGPASIMTVMRYYKKLGANELSKETEMRIANEMGAESGLRGGTTSSQMVDWLTNHGFSVQSGKNITTDMLMDNIKKGVLTIVSYDNHWIVAKGYNVASKSPSKQDEIIFADSCCGISVIARDVIDNTWQDAHLQHSHCSVNGDYIIATPN